MKINQFTQKGNVFTLTDDLKNELSLKLRRIERSFRKGQDVKATLKLAKIAKTLISPHLYCLLKMEVGYNGTGYLIMKNLPSDAMHCMSVLIQLWMGIPIKFEGEGAMVITIKPVLGVTETGFANDGKFPGHTDMSYVDLPPRYMCMGVIRQDAEERGRTIIGDSKKALSKLSEQEIRALSQEQFTFRTPAHFQESGSVTSNKRVLTLEAEKIFARVRKDKIHCRNPEGLEAFEKFSNLLNGYAADEFLLPPNSLIFIDNHRCTHARHAFKATFDDYDRELIRSYGTDSISNYGDKLNLETYTVSL